MHQYAGGNFINEMNFANVTALAKMPSVVFQRSEIQYQSTVWTQALIH